MQEDHAAYLVSLTSVSSADWQYGQRSVGGEVV